MRIGIDCRKLTEGKTGIGNYLENILKEIVYLDQRNEYYLFFDSKPDEQFSANHVHYITVDLFKDYFKNKLYQPVWLNLILPIYLRKHKIDLFWGPNFVKPLIYSAPKNIITIHDLAFLYNRKDHSLLHSLYLRIVLKLTVRNRIKVLTVSEFSKRDILKHFNVLKENINITYCAIDQLSEELNKLSETYIVQKYKIPNQYMLFVGTTEKRKNLSLVLHSIAYSLKQELSILPLVVVGAKGNGLIQLRQLAEKLKIEKYIHFLGYIPEKDLKAIYKNSSIFVFPSFYEGFGIPIIEAMSYGVPVITSNVTSLPEVAGNAALLINPSSVEELSIAIDKLIHNHSLREQLIQNGFKRVNYFSWKESARVFVKTIESFDLKGERGT